MRKSKEIEVAKPFEANLINISLDQALKELSQAKVTYIMWDDEISLSGKDLLIEFDNGYSLMIDTVNQSFTEGNPLNVNACHLDRLMLMVSFNEQNPDTFLDPDTFKLYSAEDIATNFNSIKKLFEDSINQYYSAAIDKEDRDYCLSILKLYNIF